MSERLDDLCNALGEAADGKRHLPVIQPGDASLVVGLFHSQIDLATRAIEERVIAAGHAIACRRGCSDCCHNVPVVFAGEAVAIVEWLRLPEHADVLAGFRARYPAWAKGLERDLEAWRAAMASGDVDAAARTIQEAWGAQVMCAFNDGGACSIYEVRPAICRTAHALDTNEQCRPGATGDVVTFRFPPLEQYLEKIQPIIMALHAALRPDGGSTQPLCLAVHEELASAR